MEGRPSSQIEHVRWSKGGSHAVVILLDNGAHITVPVSLLTDDRRKQLQGAQLSVSTDGGSRILAGTETFLTLAECADLTLGNLAKLSASLTGKATSDAKTRAARINGKKGGRPPSKR